MNLSKSFDSGFGQYMRKATCPSGGMHSSNPRHQRGQIHATRGVGGSTTMVVVFVVCLCCVLRLVWLSSLTLCQKVWENNPKVGL